MILREVHSTELDAWIRERHYLASVPAGASLRLEFLDEGGQRIGAMMWGRPVAWKTDQARILQLTRMYFVDHTPHCTESRALGMARKYIRKHRPQIKGLVTFASTTEHHKGTIYLADGWFLIGTTKNAGRGWESRDGRQSRDTGDKLKFARSP